VLDTGSVERDKNVFVAKFAPSGELLWAKDLGISGLSRNDFARSTAIDSHDNVLVAGAYAKAGQADVDLDMFLVRFSALGDEMRELLRSQGSGRSDAWGVAVNPDDVVYVAGFYQGSVELAGRSMTSAGRRDALLIRRSPSRSRGDMLSSISAGTISRAPTLEGRRPMSFRPARGALVVAILAGLPGTGGAAGSGSCLESSRALRNHTSTYTWCPDGWKETRDGDTITFRCGATSVARSYKRNAKGGEFLSIDKNRDTAEKCK
jgi:hypothetical protein